EYSDPYGVGNLTETAPVAVVQNPSEAHHFSHHNLEEELDHGLQRRPSYREAGSLGSQRNTRKVGRFKTSVFISANLVVFSILGTLARLGLSALTAYTAGPVRFGSLWPNFAGSLILGFLSEGAELFHHPRAARSLSREAPNAKNDSDRRSPSDTEDSVGGTQEKEVPVAAGTPLPVPLYIGLATGFCGSLTSYSAFMRDSFETLAGMLGSATPRPSPGQDIMSVATVIIATLGLSAAGMKFGAHVAIFINRYERKLSKRAMHATDWILVILGVGLWAGAVIMAILPPDRPSGPVGSAESSRQETWRGQALFSLIFAPLGCLLRFAASTRLNNRIVGFPLGTFCVNMFGTLLLTVVWDLQRLPNRGIAANIGGDLIACQVLQGIEDGFCGCLTTVSTWILELSSLRRRHAYRYGIASIVTSLVIVIIVMGCVTWTLGLRQPVC
ncbi:hypothetical protein BR93DRAFT_858832, partial [Coniochaeta sp. PMI_546]